MQGPCWVHAANGERLLLRSGGAAEEDHHLYLCCVRIMCVSTRCGYIRRWTADGETQRQAAWKNSSLQSECSLICCLLVAMSCRIFPSSSEVHCVNCCNLVDRFDIAMLICSLSLPCLSRIPLKPSVFQHIEQHCYNLLLQKKRISIADIEPCLNNLWPFVGYSDAASRK